MLEMVVIQWPWTVHNFRVHTWRQEKKNPVVKKKKRGANFSLFGAALSLNLCKSVHPQKKLIEFAGTESHQVKSLTAETTLRGRKLRRPPLKPRGKLGETLQQSPLHCKSVNPGNIPSDKVHVVKNLSGAVPVPCHQYQQWWRHLTLSKLRKFHGAALEFHLTVLKKLNSKFFSMVAIV